MAEGSHMEVHSLSLSISAWNLFVLHILVVEASKTRVFSNQNTGPHLGSRYNLFTPPAANQGIQATSRAFAAIRSDGTVATWGDADAGGESGYVQEQRPGCGENGDVQTGGMKKRREELGVF